MFRSNDPILTVGHRRNDTVQHASDGHGISTDHPTSYVEKNKIKIMSILRRERLQVKSFNCVN